MTEATETTSQDEIPAGESTPQSLEGFKALALFTAEHASVENSKLYINGGFWNTLGFVSFPVTLAPGAVVAVIQVPWHANNHDHEFTVELVDSDGQAMPNFKVQGKFRGSPTPHMKYGDAGVMPVAIPYFGVQIERPGEYSFVLKVDGAELDRYKLTVLHLAAPGGGFALQPPTPAST